MTWPPKPGELWMSMEHWPADGGKPPIRGGELVVVISADPRYDRGTASLWFKGQVLGPAGLRTIRAIEGDLIPSDDPRIGANQA